MKNEQKQEFKSSGVLALLGLVGFSVTIIAAPWNRQAQDSQVEAALQKAEVVGYQVVQIYREAAKNSEKTGQSASSRGPASLGEDARSVGTMGQDPWGQPYHFRILSKPESKAVRILVWSTGPNKKADTPDLENEGKEVSPQPIYGGDDVGLILSMTQ